FVTLWAFPVVLLRSKYYIFDTPESNPNSPLYFTPEKIEEDRGNCKKNYPERHKAASVLLVLNSAQKQNRWLPISVVCTTAPICPKTLDSLLEAIQENLEREVGEMTSDKLFILI
ncbi:hypothetical protein MC885_020388, partial [Smutsia gigantea]